MICPKCKKDPCEHGPNCPAADPPVADPTPVSLTCPCCKSVVTLTDGALVGGDPSPELESLRTKADEAHVLAGELAIAKQKVAELEANAAGGDDDDEPDDAPAPRGPSYFI